MKKTLALLLAILMVFALIGCKGGTDNNTTSPTAGQTDTAGGNTDSDADLKIVYIANSLTNVFCYNISVALESFEDEYNFDLITGTYDNDGEKFINLVETYIDQQVDGFVLNCRKEFTQAIYDIIKPSGIPFVSESTNMEDANGNLLTPGVELNAYENGKICSQWILDNYADIGLDASDPSKVGFISVSYSAIASFNERSQGATETFEAAFPDCENVFEADCLAQGAMTPEAAYTEVSAILAGNPQVQTWFIVGILDDLAQGAARAVEAAGLDSKTIISSVGGEVLVQEWDSGYEGCWMACGYFEAMDFVKQDLPALMSVINGEATLEDLFPEWKEEGQTYGAYQILGDMATKDTYKEIMAAHRAS